MINEILEKHLDKSRVQANSRFLRMLRTICTEIQKEGNLSRKINLLFAGTLACSCVSKQQYEVNIIYTLVQQLLRSNNVQKEKTRL